MRPLDCLKIEPPRENDDKPWLTDVPGMFFGLCYGEVNAQGHYLALGGPEREFPKGTAVWIVLRANGRILLQTETPEGKFHRWGDRAFLQDRRERAKGTPASSASPAGAGEAK
jgi:hypothetical protein